MVGREALGAYVGGLGPLLGLGLLLVLVVLWLGLGHIGPESGERPPTEAPQLDDRSSIENVEEKIQRQNMLTVNFRPDRRATVRLLCRFKATGQL